MIRIFSLLFFIVSVIKTVVTHIHFLCEIYFFDMWDWLFCCIEISLKIMSCKTVLVVDKKAHYHWYFWRVELLWGTLFNLGEHTKQNSPIIKGFIFCSLLIQYGSFSRRQCDFVYVRKKAKNELPRSAHKVCSMLTTPAEKQMGKGNQLVLTLTFTQPNSIHSPACFLLRKALFAKPVLETS